jgi:hypothetical protein
MPPKKQQQTEETAVVPMDMGTRFGKQDRTDISSWDDAVRLAQGEFGTVLQIHDTELGDGFRVASEEDERRLIGVPLMLLEWRWNDGDFGEYVSVVAIAQGENGQATKWIINDGSTGIREQIRDFETKYERNGGLMVRNGLRVSDYHTDLDTGMPISKKDVVEYHKDGRKTGKGHTFYLDTSA